MNNLNEGDVLIHYWPNCELPWTLSCAINGAGYGEWGFVNIEELIARLKIILKIHQEEVYVPRCSFPKKGSKEMTRLLEGEKQ